MRCSARCLRQVDPLSRPKDSARTALFIARYSPQPQRYVERINAKRRPERKLANPMLFGVTCDAQRNGIANSRFHPQTAIGSGPHMGSL